MCGGIIWVNRFPSQPTASHIGDSDVTKVQGPPAVSSAAPYTVAFTICTNKMTYLLGFFKQGMNLWKKTLRMNLF